MHRFIPEVILDSFPDRPITFDAAMTIARKFTPTPPFKME
jgi:hypothetical protein